MNSGWQIQILSVSFAALNLVLRSVSALIDQEAMRVVRKMPPWIPGLQRGKPVAVAYRLPIRFALTEKRSKK
jgi:hypothetical protein